MFNKLGWNPGGYKVAACKVIEFDLLYTISQVNDNQSGMIKGASFGYPLRAPAKTTTNRIKSSWSQAEGLRSRFIRD
jgi:hypothetical protein